MVWQKRMMKGMKGEWVMDLHLRVRSGFADRVTGDKGWGWGVIGDGPVDVCFKIYSLPSRLGDHRDAPVVFSQSIPRGVDAFPTECRARRLLRRDAPVDERKHRQANDPVRTLCYVMKLQS